MKTLPLSFEQKAKDYQILIGRDLLLSKQVFLDVITGTNVLIVSNETIAPHYLPSLKETLSNKKLHSFVLPDGEEYKSAEYFHHLLDFMIEAQLKRNDTVIALGGGVVGDLVGFTAASYFRGINFIQVPTSLLAQVDSSVGGKTAINHPKGKNLIGAFYQPLRVVTDVATLSTLPRREYISGIAEVVKIAMICDLEFFEWLEKHASAILSRQDESLITMIEWACRLKAQIVSQDEQEQGIRATLNLGHTFAHAIENKLGYGKLLHGEAVSIGIYWASLLSCQLKLISDSQLERIKTLLASFELAQDLPESFEITTDSIKAIASSMQLDKKNDSAFIKLILPDGLGKVTFNDSYSWNKIDKFLRGILLYD